MAENDRTEKKSASQRVRISWRLGLLLGIIGASQALSQACSTLPDDGPVTNQKSSSSAGSTYSYGGTSANPLTGGQDAVSLQAKAAYQDILGRQPDAATLNARIAAMNARTLTNQQLRQELALSTESANNVRSRFLRYLNRVANDAELQTIQGQLVAGGLTFATLDSFFTSNSAFSSTVRDFVRNAYRNVLLRNPEQSAVDNIRSAISNGQTYVQIRQGVATSDEARGYLNQVFQRSLKRDPRGDEVTRWTNLMAQGGGLADVQGQLLASGDFTGLYSSQEAKYVARAYVEILGRAPDDGGLQTYVNLIRSTGRFQDVRTILADSAEAANAINGIYGLLGREALVNELYDQKKYLEAGGNLILMRIGLLSGGTCMGTPACAGGQ